MTDIDKFVEVQRLWSRYERCEQQLSELYHSTEKAPSSLYDRAIAKTQLIVIEALNRISDMLLNEIRNIGWYENCYENFSTVNTVGGDS